MAISKIKAITNTLKKAIEYISNPDKTSDRLLVSTFGCSLETADIEFELTARKGSDTGNRVAYHMMQSFSPEDNLSPEKAHELGMQFAKEMTKGRYEFVVTTHTDRNHIHNHIIFNATSFIDQKKYHYSVSEKHRMRRVNDKICRENHLSVIENPSKQRGLSKYEYEQKKAGTSWKDQLRADIDQAIQKSDSYEEFIEMMKMEGCEIKGAELDKGKYISFCPIGVGRFVRGSERSLGAEYTKERISERIENKELEKVQKSVSPDNFEMGKNLKAETDIKKRDLKTEKEQSRNKQYRPDTKKINLLANISENIKAQQSKGYEQALIRSNINNLVKSMNYLIRHKVESIEDYKSFSAGLMAEYNMARKSIKKLDDDLIDLSEMIKFTKNHREHKSVYKKFTNAEKKEEFYQANQDAILQYQVAMVFFEKREIAPASVNLPDLFEQYRQKKQERTELYNTYSSLKKDVKEMQTVGQNLERALGISIMETADDSTPKVKKDKFL